MCAAPCRCSAAVPSCPIFDLRLTPDQADTVLVIMHQPAIAAYGAVGCADLDPLRPPIAVFDKLDIVSRHGHAHFARNSRASRAYLRLPIPPAAKDSYCSAQYRSRSRSVGCGGPCGKESPCGQNSITRSRSFAAARARLLIRPDGLSSEWSIDGQSPVLMVWSPSRESRTAGLSQQRMPCRARPSRRRTWHAR